MTQTHRGPWADSPAAAVEAAMWEVGIAPGEWVECRYGEGSLHVSVDPEHPWEIHTDVAYSEGRDQYKATVRRTKAINRQETT